MTALHITSAPPAGAAIPSALANFGGLPDAAYVRLPTMQAIYGGVSGPTIWRWAAAGAIPSPVRLSGRVTAWRVGDIRADLARRAAPNHKGKKECE
ncbi:AlpA family phage regulatory protein [Zoogloea oleivorans]|uniref:AlpA family phage regulatory protein n=1 Tax=Zoogloea oleivorans TaxID=1552750 RepID=A0A6C2D4T4_9RHOO|nr:AlpA family phage regulatory protein [Zoogloea oleivorans]